MFRRQHQDSRHRSRPSSFQTEMHLGRDATTSMEPKAKMRVCAASTEGPVGRMRVTEEDSNVATASLAQHICSLFFLDTNISF